MGGGSNAVNNLTNSIGNALNIPANVVLWVGIALIAVIVIAIVVIVLVAVNKRKKRKAAVAEWLSKPEPLTVAEREVKKPQVQTKKEETDTQEQPENEEKPEQPQEEQLEQEKPDEEKTEELQKEEKEAPVKKSEPKKTPAKKDEKPTKKLNGKWIIEVKGQGEYLAKLCASNGEVMLTSEIYTTEDGARGGVATIKKGVDTGKFIVYQDKNGNYYYKLKTANNRLLCVGEIYKSKEQCLKAVESVKRLAKDASISAELNKGVQYIDYIPAPVNSEIKKGTRGKWRIEKTDDDAYSAKLYASNGQLMLATEEVAQKKSALNAILAVKKNAEAGNFIIDKDKFGRYYYKMRNAQKSVICIGEAYDTLESCTSAIESVRRFALTAVVPGEKE